MNDFTSRVEQRPVNHVRGVQVAEAPTDSANPGSKPGIGQGINAPPSQVPPPSGRSAADQADRDAALKNAHENELAARKELKAAEIEFKATLHKHHTPDELVKAVTLLEDAAVRREKAAIDLVQRVFLAGTGVNPPGLKEAEAIGDDAVKRLASAQNAVVKYVWDLKTDKNLFDTSPVARPGTPPELARAAKRELAEITEKRKNAEMELKAAQAKTDLQKVHDAEIKVGVTLEDEFNAAKKERDLLSNVYKHIRPLDEYYREDTGAATKRPDTEASKSCMDEMRKLDISIQNLSNEILARRIGREIQEGSSP